MVQKITSRIFLGLVSLVVVQDRCIRAEDFVLPEASLSLEGRALSTTFTTVTATITQCGLEVSSTTGSGDGCGHPTEISSPWSPTRSTTLDTSPASESPTTSDVPPSTTSLPLNEQSGNSTWGTLHQPALPKWLGDPANCPWGNRTVSTSPPSLKSHIPNTNITRHYNLTLSRTHLRPDGVLREMLTLNSQFPDPLIHFNLVDWIQVTIHNNISDPGEGTAIHWHGMPQRFSPWDDGTPGVTQCPIAPGRSYTYRFRAEVYGSSFYHAHYSAQYTAGVVGPMVVYGPIPPKEGLGGYEVDLGPVMLSDWFHVPYTQTVREVLGTDLGKIPPRSVSGLVNGRGRYDCSLVLEGGRCVEGAEYAKFSFQRGKRYRLRVMNTGADGVHKFSIDGHRMVVIATDYVPVQPCEAGVITLGVGQRTDIVVAADGDPKASYWMRSHLPGGPLCGGLGVPTGIDADYPQILAAIYYTASDIDVLPTTSPSPEALDSSCDNDDLATTIPAYPIAPAPDPYYQPITLTLVLNATGSWEWRTNDQTYHADYNSPVLYPAATGNTSYRALPNQNIIDLASNTSILLHLVNWTPTYHPFHLHGHTFSVLAVGPASTFWDGSIVRPENPMRRDVQMVPAGGWAVLQFEADNPGVWPLHCHAAWHLSGGLAVNLVVRPGEVEGMPEGKMGETCRGWEEFLKDGGEIGSGS